jgi:hypothetical protein
MTKERRIYSVALLIIALQALLLLLFGQPPICACGTVKIWEGVVLSPGNSQHLTDWYTFSHLIHGVIFYYALRYLFPRLGVAWRFILAVCIESAWEVIENTPMVIDAYRQQALAQGYTGDSIINSVSDSIAMMLGFFAASKWSPWLVVGAAFALELFTAFMIRDNLTFNIINLIHHFDFLNAWQAGA